MAIFQPEQGHKERVNERTFPDMIMHQCKVHHLLKKSIKIRHYIFKRELTSCILNEPCISSYESFQSLISKPTRETIMHPF